MKKCEPSSIQTINRKERRNETRRFSRGQMRLNAGEEMINVETLNIRLNRTLLLAVGLWPYQQSKLVQLQLVLQFGILGTFIVFQFSVFVTSKCNVDLIINVLATALCYFVCMSQYISYKFHIETIKYLLEQLQHIYDELQDENEIIIIRKYGSNARCYTVIMTLSFLLFASILILYPFWPRILDILLPMKESRPYPPLLFGTEYLVDQERYLYLINFYANIAFFIGIIAIISTGTITAMIYLHVCGMFQIANYRIEHSMIFNNMKRHKENKNLIYKRLVCAIDIHRRALMLATTVTSKFATTFLLLIIFGVVCGSFNLFQLTHEISTGRNPGKILTSFVILFIHLLYLSASSIITQEMTDHNSNVFATIYNIRWYTAPLHIQKMTLFMLQVGMKPFHVNIGGIFYGSLETALSLISVTISYFAVLHSVRH